MIPGWVLKLPWDKIDKVSRLEGVNSKIVGAIVMQESGGNHLATRYEDHYKWTLNPITYARKLKISMDTELVHQKTSWGLTQCMGAVARESGFEGNLTELTDPEINLRCGIRKLLQLKKRYHDNLHHVIAAYNAGSARFKEDGSYVNQEYLNSVMRYLKAL